MDLLSGSIPASILFPASWELVDSSIGTCVRTAATSSTHQFLRAYIHSRMRPGLPGSGAARRVIPEDPSGGDIFAGINL